MSNEDLIKKVAIAVATLLLGMGGGATGMGLKDVFNAKTFIEDKAIELAEAEAAKERVLALEAQVEILMTLVAKNECRQ